ncbi:hypothetical protein HY009_10660 [Candidatus Acetothermia bacterium]|nr:hypothetical protein [Candidatus Acetothermia bacterium]
MKKWAKNKVADLRWAVQVLLIFGLVVPIAVLGVAGYAVPVPPLGELRTRVIIHPPNCEFISPEILCPEPRSVHKLLEPKMILQTQLNLTLPHLFSTEQGFFRSFTIFSTHFLPRAVCTDPGPLPRCPVRTPFEMQAFKLHFPLNEFLFIRETLVFSNRLVVLDNELAPLQEFGSLFSPTVFRKNRLEFEFGFGGFILVADLLTDNRNCLEPSVIPQNPTFPLPIVCTVMSPDVVHIPQLAHGLKFIFILPFPGILISDLQIFINADEGLEYVGTGTQPEELVPEAVIRPNSGLQKIALTIRNLTIAGVTFKITAFTKAN